MGIAQVGILVKDLFDRFFGLFIITATGKKAFRQLFHYIGIHCVPSGFTQLAEPFRDFFVIPSAQIIKQTLQIGRDQNIHRRGDRGMEITDFIVSPGFDKISQNIIGIGSTDQFSDRHAHLFRIVRRQNVAEVPGRHYHVDKVAHSDLFVFDQFAVGGDIVHNLRQQTSPVDGVSRGEHHIVFRQLCHDLRIGKDLLYPGLRVVKIPFDRADCHIFPFLCGHLAFLHSADAVFRIEHQDLCIRHILKALQSSFSGIAAGRYQNDDLFPFSYLFSGGRQQVWQNLQRHIFKRTGWSVPQFQHISAV